MLFALSHRAACGVVLQLMPLTVVRAANSALAGVKVSVCGCRAGGWRTLTEVVGARWAVAVDSCLAGVASLWLRTVAAGGRAEPRVDRGAGAAAGMVVVSTASLGRSGVGAFFVANAVHHRAWDRPAA